MRTYVRQVQLLWLGVLLYLVGKLQALSKTDFYPYGVQQGDERLPVGDDISSSEVQLVVPISFYESLHTSLYVSTRISFYLLLLLFYSYQSCLVHISLIDPTLDTNSLLSGYHADTPITIKAEPSIWPTAALINIHEHPI